MRPLLLSLLLFAGPAAAYPQWLVVSADRTVQIDYNSVRAHGSGVRSVDVAILGGPTGQAFISCDRWRYATQTDGAPHPSGWSVIPPGRSIETIAYAICPGPEQVAWLRALQQRDAPATGRRFDRSLEDLVRDGVVTPEELQRARQEVGS